VADATKSSDESLQGQRKWRRRSPWIVGIFVATLIGSTALLHSAAQPQSWFRNLTGLQLSLKEPDGIVRVGRREDFPTEDVIFELSERRGLDCSSSRRQACCDSHFLHSRWLRYELDCETEPIRLSVLWVKIQNGWQRFGWSC
jgi:hypothetical protein